jgi:hypothetical protein
MVYQTSVLKTADFKKMAAENVFSRVGFSKKNLQTPEMQNQNNEILQLLVCFRPFI